MGRRLSECLPAYNLYVYINASFLYLVSHTQKNSDPSATFANAEMLHCSIDTGKCEDSVCSGSAEVALYK